MVNDLISRQAAIDEAEEWIEVAYYGHDEQRERDAIKHVINGIKKLPSVQPEPKWIPCSETVDIPDHEILACDKYGEMMLGYLVYEDNQWICIFDGCEMCDPIAWREKPEPYREEGE